MADPKDADLLEAARAGDDRALDELLSRHEKRVYRFGLRMCGSEEDAKEVLQETLLAAFRGLRDFRGDAELSTWLYQVARTYCLRQRRRRAGQPENLESIDSPTSQKVASERSGPEELSHARQMGEVLQAAILALSDSSREVLILRDVEGLTAEEAAKVVGIDVRALKSRLHRARLQLREHLSVLLGEGAMPDNHACPELAAELSDYASQEIDQATCVRIEEHLARCPHCAAACEALKRSVSLCRRLPGDEVPAPVRAAVRQALARSNSAAKGPQGRA